MSAAAPGAMVHFIGGGPGAPDLLTLRAAEIVGRADVVIWGANLLMEETVTSHARPDAELVPWPPATMGDLHAVYDRAAAEGLVVARLYAGDATIFARIGEEVGDVAARGLPYEIVPGVSALGAAAAALRWDLTGPRDDQRPLSLIHRGAGDGAGGVTAVYGVGREPAELQRRLLERGYPPETQCGVARRVSFPDESLTLCALAELAKRLGEGEGDPHTLVLVGPAGRPGGGALSAP